MSLHRSLKTRPTALAHHRNVLKRDERITRLMERDGFKPGEDSPLGLLKVANRVMAAGKKKKATKEAAAGEKAADTAAAPTADAKAAGKTDAKAAGKTDAKAKTAGKPAGKGKGK